MAEKKDLIRGLLAIESRLVMDRLEKAKPGETVSYEELDQIAGCNVRKQRYILTTPINKLLNEQAKVFVADWGKGIRLLRNEEIPSLGARDIGRVGRLAKRSIKRLAASDYDTLSPQGKIFHNTHLTILSLIQRGSTAKSIAIVEGAVKKNTNPLPMVETLKLFERS